MIEKGTKVKWIVVGKDGKVQSREATVSLENKDTETTFHIQTMDGQVHYVNKENLEFV